MPMSRSTRRRWTRRCTNRAISCRAWVTRATSASAPRPCSPATHPTRARGAIMENTSGQGYAAQVPVEAARWNWGAFLLTWIWGIGNSTFIAFLCFVPFANFVMPFVLGARGGEWAWRNKRWDSIEHFRATQRKWGIWGLVVLIASFVLSAVFFASLFFAVATAMQHSGAYQSAVRQLKANPDIVQILGRPISTGIPNGSLSSSNGKGKALFSFSVSGPKGEGKVAIKAWKANGTWHLTRAIFRDADSGRVIPFGERGNDTPADDTKPRHANRIFTQTGWDRESDEIFRGSRYLPISSCHRSGCSSMNWRMRATHSASSSTSRSMPRKHSRLSSPMKFRFSPMTTRGMPYNTMAPLHIAHGDKVV